jgi:hypothetical protein
MKFLLLDPAESHQDHSVSFTTIFIPEENSPSHPGEDPVSQTRSKNRISIKSLDNWVFCVTT